MLLPTHGKCSFPLMAHSLHSKLVACSRTSTPITSDQNLPPIAYGMKSHTFSQAPPPADAMATLQTMKKGMPEQLTILQLVRLKLQKPWPP